MVITYIMHNATALYVYFIPDKKNDLSGLFSVLTEEVTKYHVHRI